MKNVTRFSYEIQKEANKETQKIGWIVLIVGIVATLIFILGLALGATDTDSGDTLLFLAIFDIIFGAVILMNVRKTNKNYNNDGCVNEYDFLDDSVTLHSTKNGETIANIKFTYEDFIRLRETESFIFLYINQVSLYPIDKCGVPQEELDFIRSKVKAGIKQRKANKKKKKHS